MRDYRNIFNKVVPYHTDNSMSLYEFVGRLYEYIKSFEGSLDEAHEKIDEFTHSFNMELDDTTKKILTDWHDDGTLAELINLVWEDKAERSYVDNSIRTLANSVQFKFISDSVLEYALTLETYLKLISVNLATDVPSSHKYSSGFVLRRGEVDIKIILFSYYDPSNVVQNVYNGEWQGWTDIGLKSVKANITANTQEIARVESALNTKITGVETSLVPIKATWAENVKFSAGYISVWRIGKLCITTGFFRFTQEVPTALEWTLGVVPVGFRPDARVTTWGVAQSSQSVMIKIEPDGQITVYNYGENPIMIESGVTANLTWITND